MRQRRNEPIGYRKHTCRLTRLPNDLMCVLAAMLAEVGIFQLAEVSQAAARFALRISICRFAIPSPGLTIAY